MTRILDYIKNYGKDPRYLPHMTTCPQCPSTVHYPLKYSTPHHLVHQQNFITTYTLSDLMIYIKEGQLHTRLYIKPTHRHMYLNYTSEHPPSLKRSIFIHNFLRTPKSILIHNIYWKQKYTYISISYGEINHMM